MTFPFSRRLPNVGADETDTLEFKCDVEPKKGSQSSDRFELAKDVSAFANAAGGTILVGACGKSTLQRYNPLERDHAARIAREFEEATRDRCAPPPSLTTEMLQHDGGVILAIHVSPFPVPVAVKVRGDKADGYGDPAWTFWRRVASQNVPFRPEELPMLMTPEIRRIALLLRAIGFNQAHVVRRTSSETAATIRYDKGRSEVLVSKVVEVDELRNTVLFEKDDATSGRFTVPLDHVVTVFRNPVGAWIVNVAYFQTEQK